MLALIRKWTVMTEFGRDIMLPVFQVEQ